MCIILATQEAEIRSIVVQSQPRQIVCEILSQKKKKKKTKPLPKKKKKRWWSGSTCRPWVQVPIAQKKEQNFRHGFRATVFGDWFSFGFWLQSFVCLFLASCFQTLNLLLKAFSLTYFFQFSHSFHFSGHSDFLMFSHRHILS
jgi:hypothetical protein